MFKKILFSLSIILVLANCNSKKQDNLYPIIFLEESNNIPKLAIKTYNSIDKNIFFELCQLLNDSINKRTDYFYLRSAINIDKRINETTNEVTNEIKLGFIEDGLIPKGIPNELLFHICITETNTIYAQNKQTDIDNLKEELKKFVLGLSNLDRNIASRKIHTDLFGEVEVDRFLVFLTINAKGNKLSSNEWLLFFKCLQEIVIYFEEERNKLSIEKLGKNFNSLTFEQKEAISDIASYQIVLIFDEECPR